MTFSIKSQLRNNLLIVGSVAFDTITTPFAHGDDVLGGSATHAALAASFFVQPQIVAVVGEDFSEGHKKILADRNVDLQGLEQVSGKTFRWGGKYDFDLNGRTTLFTHLNVFENFQPKLPESYKQNKYVFLGNIHPSLQENVLGQIERAKFVGLDTMNFWIEKAPQELANVLTKINVLLINDSEARELTGEANVYKAAKKILVMMGQAKSPLLIIKRGEYGLLMFQGENFFSMPGYPLEEVVDPTGAGDTFAGAFLAYLAATDNITWENLKKACLAGSPLASFCVEKLGTGKLLTITQEEIQKRANEFKQLTEFSGLN